MRQYNTDKNLFIVTRFILITALFFLVIVDFAQTKNPHIIQADLNFKNEAYFDAIDLYKKGEGKRKRTLEKGRINFKIAECYRLDVEPAQAETYYKRAMKLKYQKDHPKLYILLAEVLVEEGMIQQRKIFVNILKFFQKIFMLPNYYLPVNTMLNGLEMVLNIKFRMKDKLIQSITIIHQHGEILNIIQ